MTYRLPTKKHNKIVITIAIRSSHHHTSLPSHLSHFEIHEEHVGVLISSCDLIDLFDDCFDLLADHVIHCS